MYTHVPKNLRVGQYVVLPCIDGTNKTGYVSNISEHFISIVKRHIDYDSPLAVKPFVYTHISLHKTLLNANVVVQDNGQIHQWVLDMAKGTENAKS